MLVHFVLCLAVMGIRIVYSCICNNDFTNHFVNSFNFDSFNNEA